MAFASPRRSYDEVELHAERSGNEISVFLRRATAEMQRTELEMDGWVCAIRGSDAAGGTDRSATPSERGAVYDATRRAAARAVDLAGEAGRLSDEAARLHLASRAARRDAVAVRTGSRTAGAAAPDPE